MTSGYLPIEAYGAIGNLRSIALVSREGSLDWLALPHMESPSVFAALLDHRRGGRFAVSPTRGRARDQRYVEHTNVLDTVFDAEGGRLVVTDFMPLGGTIEGCGESTTEDAVYRRLVAEGGSVEVEVEWSPRLDYGRAMTRILPAETGFVAGSAADALFLAGLPDDARVEIGEDHVGPVLRARFRVEPGRPRAVVTRWGSGEGDHSEAAVAQRLERTIDVWRSWVHKEEATGERAWAGEWRAEVLRSELALKLLTHADTGAVAAAGTTSLPEEIGGVRNWDYRLTWIRDAALVAQSLFALGHRPDAEAFIRWAERAARDEGQHSWGLQIAYGLHGQEELDERELVNLEGYRRSAPVRIGNEAGTQLQLDIYGELLLAADELVRMGGDLDPEVLRFLPRVADLACEAWQKPDYGIWELRNGPFHLVYSKAMVWVALDRAIRLAGEGLIEGDVERWKRSRAQVRDQVLAKGYDRQLGAFKQSYERAVLDASNVRLSILEFLDPTDPRVESTLDRTLEDLAHGDLVYRYRADDGVAGGEGAFGYCTFWLVDALVLAGRIDEAHRMFEGIAKRRNHVGLYSEEIDPESGAFLGNFPQAYMHVGLITSSLYLAQAEGREIPVPSLLGTEPRRAERQRREDRAVDEAGTRG